jgi:hypothetical protein
MSQENKEVPKLTGSFWDAFRGRKIDRRQLLNQALDKYYPSVTGAAMSLAAPLATLTKDDFPDCRQAMPPPTPPGDAGHHDAGAVQRMQPARPAKVVGQPPTLHCEETSSDPKSPILVSLPVAAIIRAAVLQCIYWTYQQDTTAVNQNTLATALGILAVGGGVLAATQGASKGAATALAAAGAGTATANWQKAVPPIVSATAHNVIQAGVVYYPFLQMQVISFPRGQAAGYQIISVLSELWDVAGSACPGGVLKGASWFNDYVE